MKDLLKLLNSIGFTSVNPTNYKITGSPMDKGEKVLGQMNDLEKTCALFLEQKQQEHIKLHEQMENVTDKKSEAYQKLRNQHTLLMTAVKLAKSIMWASVETRFEPVKGATATAFRDGNNVVASFKKNDDNMFGMADIGLGMMVISVASRG